MELSSGSLSYTVMIDLPDSRPGNGAKFILGVESAGVGQADASSPILVPRPFAPRLPPEQCLKSISWNKVSQGQYWRRSHTINWEDVPSHSAEESWIAKGRLSLLQQHFAGKRSLNDSKRLSRLRKFRGWALCEKVLLSWCLIGTRREIVRALRAKREARLKQRTFLLLFPYADEVQQADFCEVSREELLRTFLDVTESLPPPPMSPLGRRCVEMERVNSELLRDDSCESARGAGGSPQFRYGESAEWPSREEELWALETRFAAWFRPRFAARCMMRFAEATVRSKTKALLMENWRTRLRSTCLLCWADNVALRMHNRELCYLGRLMVQRQALMPWKLAIRHNLAAASQYRAETLQRRVLYALLLSAATSEHAHARREALAPLCAVELEVAPATHGPRPLFWQGLLQGLRRRRCQKWEMQSFRKHRCKKCAPPVGSALSGGARQRIDAAAAKVRCAHLALLPHSDILIRIQDSSS